MTKARRTRSGRRAHLYRKPEFCREIAQQSVSVTGQLIELTQTSYALPPSSRSGTGLRAWLLHERPDALPGRSSSLGEKPLERRELRIGGFP